MMSSLASQGVPGALLMLLQHSVFPSDTAYCILFVLKSTSSFYLLYCNNYCYKADLGVANISLLSALVSSVLSTQPGTQWNLKEYKLTKNRTHGSD